MATKMGVGYSIDAKSADAGVQAATAGMAELGSKKCQLAILFSTGKHDPGQLQRGVRSVIGPDSKLIGGYSMGVITKDYLGYDGNQVGIAVMSSDSAEVNMFLEPGLPDNEYNVGVALGRQIRSRQYSGKPNILLMYDSVKKGATEGVSLNMATPLVEGLEQSLGAWPSAAGVGMVGDLGFNPTRQWFNDRIETSSAMALVISGSMQMDTVIMHGCYPASSYHEITKADGNVVLEIDHKPAVDMITEIMGPDVNITPEGMPFFVTLGVNRGDKFGEYREEDYANRLVLAVDEHRKGLVMFEPNLTEGTEFQLMARNFDFQYVRDRSKVLLKRLANRRTVFALYIDCTARAGAFCGSEGEEAAAVQEVIGARMPLLGIYSGVEIAKVGQSMQALDWTGVLCIFSE